MILCIFSERKILFPHCLCAFFEIENNLNVFSFSRSTRGILIAFCSGNETKTWFLWTVQVTNIRVNMRIVFQICTHSISSGFQSRSEFMWNINSWLRASGGSVWNLHFSSTELLQSVFNHSVVNGDNFTTFSLLSIGVEHNKL